EVLKVLPVGSPPRFLPYRILRVRFLTPRLFSFRALADTELSVFERARDGREPVRRHHFDGLRSLPRWPRLVRPTKLRLWLTGPPCIPARAAFHLARHDQYPPACSGFCSRHSAIAGGTSVASIIGPCPIAAVWARSKVNRERRRPVSEAFQAIGAAIVNARLGFS